MAGLYVENISLGYEGNTVAKDISFRVSLGDYLCVIGGNGAGKSTLIKAVLGLHKPLAGVIRLGDGLRRGDFGYLPQQRDMQRDFPASACEVVLSGCINRCGLRPFYNRKEQTLARGSMEKLGIVGLSKCCYRELSGGQQQRVLLARALCAAKKILVLDEPVAGLDPAAARDMYEITADLNRGGLTVVMVSHDTATALNYASHILKMEKDAPCFFGAGGEYRARSGERKPRSEGADSV
ncbi:MAG: ATP-binding cassette domain-containing protein [Clostridiales bacterium]|jgi:zinc transport system ATP-binding protein|nr:ATP-binding cassette domain-containing protein [Clostridiales bacterium]